MKPNDGHPNQSNNKENINVRKKLIAGFLATVLFAGGYVTAAARDKSLATQQRIAAFSSEGIAGQVSHGAFDGQPVVIETIPAGPINPNELAVEFGAKHPDQVATIIRGQTGEEAATNMNINVAIPVNDLNKP